MAGGEAVVAFEAGVSGVAEEEYRYGRPRRRQRLWRHSTRVGRQRTPPGIQLGVIRRKRYRKAPGEIAQMSAGYWDGAAGVSVEQAEFRARMKKE